MKCSVLLLILLSACTSERELERNELSHGDMSYYDPYNECDKTVRELIESTNYLDVMWKDALAIRGSRKLISVDHSTPNGALVFFIQGFEPRQPGDEGNELSPIAWIEIDSAAMQIGVADIPNERVVPLAHDTVKLKRFLLQCFTEYRRIVERP